MNHATFRPLWLGAISLAAAGLLSACAATPGASPAPGPMGPRGGAGAMDMQAMCDMHRQMMSKPPAERQAMMQEQMRSMSMSSDAMHKHMQDMQARCK